MHPRNCNDIIRLGAGSRFGQLAGYDPRRAQVASVRQRQLKAKLRRLLAMDIPASAHSPTERGLLRRLRPDGGATLLDTLAVSLVGQALTGRMAAINVLIKLVD